MDNPPENTALMDQPQKHAGGRPTIYKPEYCQAVDDYIEDCKGDDDLPTKTGFALYLECSKRVIANWAEKYSEFMQALEKLMDTQHVNLINKGLNGKYNAAITKLILSANHGMSETIDHNFGISTDLQALLTEFDGQSRGLPQVKQIPSNIISSQVLNTAKVKETNNDL